MAIYGQRSITDSVEWIGVPDPFFDTGVSWTDKLLVPKARWGDRVRFGYWAWGAQPGVLIGDDVLWRSVVPARPAYLPRSPPENARATACRVRDARLWEHRLAWAQNVLYAHHICGDERVNHSNDDWDDIWDEPADQ